MLSDEMATKITGAGLTTGYTVMRGRMQPDPDKLICLYDGPGAGPQFVLGVDGIAFEEPTLQVRVRGEVGDYDGPHTTVNAIYKALAGYGAFTVGAVRYLSLTPLQAPFPLNRDGKDRVEWAVNFLVQKETS